MSSHFQKEFIDFINRHQDKTLCSYYLSINPLVTIQTVLENPHLDWDWVGLSENPNMTWDIVLKNPEKPWSWMGLSRNPNIGWDILRKRHQYYFGFLYGYEQLEQITLLEHPDLTQYFSIDWNSLSKSPKTPFEMLLRHPKHSIETNLPSHKPTYYMWDICGFSLNPNITNDYLRELYSNRMGTDEEQKLKLCWWNLSMNKSINWQMIEEHSKCKWIYSAVSANPNITWDIVQHNQHISWDYGFLCKNPSITWDNISKNPSVFNQYYSISSNPNITMDIIKKNPDYSWHYGGLSFNENLTIEYVEDNLDKPWNWQSLCKMPFKGSRKRYLVDWVEKKYIEKKKRKAKYVADICLEWWFHPDNAVSMGMCETMWKKREPITDLYGQTMIY